MPLQITHFLYVVCFMQISFAGEFILSYKVSTKNYVMINEKFNVARSMRDDKVAILGDIICSLSYKENQTKLKKAIKKHKDEILQCLYKTGMIIQDYSKSSKSKALNQSTLVLKPLRVYVKKEYGSLNIYQVKNQE